MFTPTPTTVYTHAPLDGKKPASKDDFPKEFRYLVDENGNLILKSRLGRMRSDLLNKFKRIQTLKPSWIAPTWGRVDDELRMLIYRMLCICYEELTLCSDDWKVKTLVQDWYSNWHRKLTEKETKGKDEKGKVKEEAGAEDESPDGSAMNESTSLDIQGAISSIVPSKRANNGLKPVPKKAKTATQQLLEDFDVLDPFSKAPSQIPQINTSISAEPTAALPPTSSGTALPVTVPISPALSDPSPSAVAPSAAPTVPPNAPAPLSNGLAAPVPQNEPAATSIPPPIAPSAAPGPPNTPAPLLNGAISVLPPNAVPPSAALGSAFAEQSSTAPRPVSVRLKLPPSSNASSSSKKCKGVDVLAAPSESLTAKNLAMKDWIENVQGHNRTDREFKEYWKTLGKEGQSMWQIRALEKKIELKKNSTRK